MMRPIFEKISQIRGCVIFPPCSQIEVVKASSLLSASGFCSIPDEYKEFLRFCDGFSYNGVEFFGIQNHNRKEKGYTFPDIAASTFHYKEYAYFKRKLVLGRISEALICYDKKTEYYAIVDRVSLRPYQGHKSFSGLLGMFFKSFEDIEKEKAENV